MRARLRVPVPALAALAALALLAAALAPAPAGAEAQVYKAQHRPAEELLPLVRAALEGRGKAVVDEASNQLVLVGEPTVLAEALALLERVDRPLRSVVLRYRSERAADLEARGVRVDWSAEGGPLRVGSVIPPEDEGVALRAEARRSREESALSGTLRVLEGRTGRIASGTTVPVRVGRPGWDESTVLVSAESGFEVSPRILGDGRVQLELRPFEARPGPPSAPAGSVAHTAASTTVAVEPGRELVLGGLGREVQAERSDLLSGAGSGAARSERLLLISVDVE